MLHRWLRSPLAWSPLAAVLVQALLAGVAVAASGGGDFPVRR